MVAMLFNFFVILPRVTKLRYGTLVPLYRTVQIKGPFRCGAASDGLIAEP
jgi:hypothetical protein